MCREDVVKDEKLYFEDKCTTSSGFRDRFTIDVGRFTYYALPFQEDSL
jgi:hypothetical protein